jgi:hypothetical protein
MWHQSKARMTQGQEEDGRPWRAGGMMEREEGGHPCSGTVEMPAGELPNARGGVTRHGHGAAVISV